MLDRYPIPGDFDFTPLTSERRSPFFGVDPNLLFGFFSDLDASMHVTPKKRDEVEGFILFRQSQPQKEVHILLSGGIVFFVDEVYMARKVGDPVAVGNTGVSAIETLRESKCYGIIRPGQIAGMLEMFLGHILPTSDGDLADPFEDSRRKALLGSSLPALTGSWLRSGYLATHSRTISIPVEKFRAALNSDMIRTKLSAQDPAKGDTNFTTEKFIRRCEEELVFRYAYYLHSKGLANEGRHDIRLAHIWYEYYLRAPDEIHRRFYNGKKKHMCHVKVDQLAWLLGIKTGDVSGPVNRLIEVGILQRTTSTGKVMETKVAPGKHARDAYFNFDPRAVKDYYLCGGDKATLEKKYKGVYSLRPIGEGEPL